MPAFFLPRTVGQRRSPRVAGVVLLLILGLLWVGNRPLLAGPYAWLEQRSTDAHPQAGRNTIQHRFAPPPGFERRAVEPGSFAHWLRQLPLLAGRPAVRLFNGHLKSNQQAHLAVVDIDVGARNLQQCADAIMRLRAEYLFSQQQWSRIRFNFTDGVPAPYTDWRQGLRPLVKKPRTLWRKTARPDSSYENFRKYLDQVFVYAGTYSLSQESPRVQSMRIGDFYIQGGFPGHAVLVADMVYPKAGGSPRFLLVQSYMPAQQMHVLRNPQTDHAWFALPDSQESPGPRLVTPEWTFAARDLKRFAH